MPERRVSNLFARRCATRDSRRETEARDGAVSGVSEPLPSLPPVYGKPYDLAYEPHQVMGDTKSHALDTQPTPAQPKLELDRWPRCPVDGHTKCFDGKVYFWSKSFPGKQQKDLLKHGDLGDDFFNGGNPPPEVWAALYRTMNCDLGQERKEDTKLVYAYRISHCPQRRAEILGLKMDQDQEEEGTRLQKAKLSC